MHDNKMLIIKNRNNLSVLEWKSHDCTVLPSFYSVWVT